jgi:uncharacterized protein YndB with AHSA1/START domain
MIRKLLIAAAAVFGMLVVVAYFLPATVQVERDRTIHAPPERVFALVADFERYREWWPWSASGTGVRYTFAGEPGTVGAKMTWDSQHPQLGAGSQEIIAAERPSLVKVRIAYGKNSKAVTTFALDPVAHGDKTRVTWRFDAELGPSPIERWVGFLQLGEAVGTRFDQGLRRLDEAATRAPTEDAIEDATAPR